MRASRRLSILAASGIAALMGAASSASAQGASTSMTEIGSLFWIVALLALLIGVFVGVVLVITIVKFRIRRGHTVPNANLRTSNHSLEAAWTIVPALILLVLGVLAFQTLMFTDTLPQHFDVQVTAIGHQWFWEFYANYTNGTVVHSVGALTLKSNETVLLLIKSVDVDHSLFIPALGVHLDAIPGHVNEIGFTPDMPGQYTIECTQFCGVSHYAMVATLTVTS